MSLALMEGVRQTIIVEIGDPNVAVVLIAVGILGIYAEFCAPGRIVPGVLGGVFVLLGLSSIAILPINVVGLALLALGVALLVLEARTASRGIAGIAGTLALTLGTVRLVDSPAPELRIHWITAMGVSLPLAATTVFLLKIALRARRNKVAFGSEYVACDDTVASTYEDGRKSVGK